MKIGDRVWCPDGIGEITKQVEETFYIELDKGVIAKFEKGDCMPEKTYLEKEKQKSKN